MKIAIEIASIISAIELGEEIKERYGKEVDVIETLYSDCCSNESYKEYYPCEDENPSEDRVMIDSVIASLNLKGRILIDILW